MGFACKYCGYVTEIEPGYSKEQEEKYLKLKERYDKANERCREINIAWGNSTHRQMKEWTSPFFIIPVGAIFLFLALSESLLFLIGVGAAFIAWSAKDYFFSFERFLEKKYPEISGSKDIEISYDERVEPSSAFGNSPKDNKWNYQFACQFCQKRNYIWVKR